MGMSMCMWVYRVCVCVCVSSRCNRLERNANDSNVVPKMGTLSTLRVQRATNKQTGRQTDTLYSIFYMVIC